MPEPGTKSPSDSGDAGADPILEIKKRDQKITELSEAHKAQAAQNEQLQRALAEMREQMAKQSGTLEVLSRQPQTKAEPEVDMLAQIKQQLSSEDFQNTLTDKPWVLGNVLTDALAAQQKKLDEFQEQMRYTFVGRDNALKEEYDAKMNEMIERVKKEQEDLLRLQPVKQQLEQYKDEVAELKANPMWSGLSDEQMLELVKTKHGGSLMQPASMVGGYGTHTGAQSNSEAKKKAADLAKVAYPNDPEKQKVFAEKYLARGGQ